MTAQDIPITRLDGRMATVQLQTRLDSSVRVVNGSMVDMLFIDARHDDGSGCWLGRAMKQIAFGGKNQVVIISGTRAGFI